MNLFNRLSPQKLTSYFKRAAKNEDGIMTVEAIIMFPLLFWAIWASYNFFEGYRQSARSLKATYALADIVSRERYEITSTYINNLYQIMNVMVGRSSYMNMRISFVRFDEADDAHYVLWSCARGNVASALTNADLSLSRDLLPVMPDNGKMILVETAHVHQRPYKFFWGSDHIIMENFVFTHPRVYDNINMDKC